jgi:hypothetical protein
MIDTEIFIDTPKVDLRDTELLRSEFGNPQMSFENYSRMLQGDNSLDLNLQPADNFEEMFPSEVLPEDLKKKIHLNLILLIFPLLLYQNNLTENWDILLQNTK